MPLIPVFFIEQYKGSILMSPISSKFCSCIVVAFYLQLVFVTLLAAKDSMNRNCATFTTLLKAEELYNSYEDNVDFKIIYCTFLKAARNGDKKAQRLIGDFYFQGRAMEPDYTSAFDWYQKAALQGDVTAQIRLADMYGSGDGVTKDCNKAVDWLFKAATSGSGEAQFLLGVVYSEGQGVSQDNILAHMWFCLAAEAGYQQAERIRDFIATNLLTRSQLKKSSELLRNHQRSKVFKSN